MSDSKKVLIVDDETDLCLLLKDYFLRKNYQVYIAHLLADGTDLLKTINPDILFLDNNLPDGLGWNIAPEIATDYPLTYIVLISAFHPAPPTMPHSALYRIIEKPISLTDLNNQFAQL